MERREFLKLAAIPPASFAASCALNAIASEPATGGTIPSRPFGKSGVRLSMIACGGYMLHGMKQQAADELVAEAVGRGVNYFDVAPTYGQSEERMGPALQPFRKKVFLACKTTQRKAEDAERELNASLKTLRTDHFDLYQLHAINEIKKDVDAVFAKGGAMETFIAAQKSGRVRFLGFSSHSVEAALAAMDRYDFDSVMFPVSLACWFKGKFGPTVVEKALQKGVAVMAMKVLARQKWPATDDRRKKYPNCWYQPLMEPQEALLGLRFAMKVGATAVISPADAQMFRMALDLCPKANAWTDQDDRKARELAVQLNPIFSL